MRLNLRIGSVLDRGLRKGSEQRLAFDNPAKMLDVFKTVSPSLGEAEASRRLPAPQLRYAIFFTPRSGSSRLTDILHSSGRLGDPGELFNPAFVPGIAQTYGATDLESYVDHVMRRRQVAGLFGCEITYSHALNLFGGFGRFFQMINPRHVFWLLREDLVAQAISLSRLRQTRVAHTAYVDASAESRAEDSFCYDPEDILTWLRRLHYQEKHTAAAFRFHGIVPEILTYEKLVAMSESEIVRHFGEALGVDVPAVEGFRSGHRKLSGDKARRFAELFLEEHGPEVWQRYSERDWLR